MELSEKEVCLKTHHVGESPSLKNEPFFICCQWTLNSTVFITAWLDISLPRSILRWAHQVEACSCLLWKGPQNLLDCKSFIKSLSTKFTSHLNQPDQYPLTCVYMDDQEEDIEEELANLGTTALYFPFLPKYINNSCNLFTHHLRQEWDGQRNKYINQAPLTDLLSSFLSDCNLGAVIFKVSKILKRGMSAGIKWSPRITLLGMEHLIKYS